MKYILLLIAAIASCQLSFAQNYVIHIDQPKQEIDNFGASDCWTMYRFGKYATEENINKVADLLFSKEFDENGCPIGIGLSMWRMNFGGGSDDNAFGCYRNIRARTPCILKKNGTYDMAIDGSCGGQFNMLKKAKERGCEYTLGFVNSPPYFMTRNGQTTGNYDPEYSLKLNLDDNGIERFTEYLAEILKRTKDIYGITFDYVDPVNEPEWTAEMGENNHANNLDIKKICISLNKRLVDDNIETNILIPESGTIQILYIDRDMDPKLDKTLYGKKIENFFGNKNSAAYVGDLPKVARIAAAHAYWSTDIYSQMINYRLPMPAVLEKYDTKYWQTEFCIGGESLDEFVTNQNTADLTINYGLMIARLMHCDLSIANASAWHWWLGMTDIPYLDGLLYLKRNDSFNVAYQLSNSDTGSISASTYSKVYQEAEVVVPKALWCFGHFSRFIRPGARRLGVTNWLGVDNIKGMMVSSYQNKDGQLVTVMINYSKSDKNVSLALNNNSNHTFIPYITSAAEGDNLRPLSEISTDDKFSLPARSIVTFVEKIGSSVSTISDDETDEIKWQKDGDKLTFNNVKNSQISIYNGLGMLLASKFSADDDAEMSINKGMSIVAITKDGEKKRSFSIYN